MVDAPRLQFVAYIAIVELRAEFAGEPVGDRRDEEAVLPLMLEAAVAVTIATVRAPHSDQPTGFYLHRLHLLYEVLGLSAVGPDVLHGRRPHLARYEREVLGTMPSVLHAGGHHIVPHLARAAAQQHAVAVVGGSGIDTMYGRAYHGAGEIGGEQQVAAPTQDKHRLSLGINSGQGIDGLLGRIKLHIPPARGVDTEGVVRLEVIIQ